MQLVRSLRRPWNTPHELVNFAAALSSPEAVERGGGVRGVEDLLLFSFLSKSPVDPLQKLGIFYM